LQELPFEVRLLMLRQSRRRLTVHRLTNNAFWVAVMSAIAIIAAIELMAALGRV